MARKHTNDDGRVLSCQAAPGSCHFDKNGPHLTPDSTPEEEAEFYANAETIAQKAAQRDTGKENSTFGTVKRELTYDDMDNAVDKAVGIFSEYTEGDKAFIDEDSLDVIWVEEDKENLEIEMEVNGRLYSVDVPTRDLDPNTTKEAMIKSLESFDADSYATEGDTDVDTMKYYYNHEVEVKKAANILRKDVGQQEQPVMTLDERVQERYEANYHKASSDLVNNQNINQLNIETVIDDYDLNHNNSEIEIDGKDVTMSVEAPNHATYSVYHNLDRDGTTVGNLRDSMSRQMSSFSADEKYNDLWSNDFGEHNNFTPSQFYVDLKADEQYFESRAKDIKADRDRL